MAYFEPDIFVVKNLLGFKITTMPTASVADTIIVLKGMIDELEQEGAADEEDYAQMACWPSSHAPNGMACWPGMSKADQDWYSEYPERARTRQLEIEAVNKALSFLTRDEVQMKRAGGVKLLAGALRVLQSFYVPAVLQTDVKQRAHMVVLGCAYQKNKQSGVVMSMIQAVIGQTDLLVV